MILNELIPSVAVLSHADKFRLVHIVLQQLAEEEAVKCAPPHHFDPRCYFGAAQSSRQDVDDYLVSVREGWSE